MERIFQAAVASRGLAIGVIHLERRGGPRGRRKGNPADERQALQSAMVVASSRLTAMIEAGDAVTAEILGFQAALLVDPALTAPAFDAIESGARADIAWASALDTMITDYQTAEDEYFRARWADLADLRDQVLEALAGTLEPSAREPAVEGAIYVASDLTPTGFVETDWSRYRGAALVGGSTAGHVAILARARGVPLVVGLRADLADLESGAPAVLDAEEGRLVLRPCAETARQYESRLAGAAAGVAADTRDLSGPATTADGTRVTVYLNVDDPALLEGVSPANADGIGLTRTEFLFPSGGPLPDEARQYGVYARLLEWAGGRPVTIRTLDAGGDKPIPGLTPERERNPFLGLRGVRLSLVRPDVFRVQLRALARAAVLGPLGVMLPMVTVPRELAEARGLFEAEVAALLAAGVPARMPALGIMIEVPACALRVADFDADFLSIGTNDLVQYTMAASRDAEAVAALRDPVDPAVLELIARVAAHGRSAGLEVSVCGEMAATPEHVPALLAAGVRALSVPPAQLAAAKAAIARWSGT